MPKKYRLSHAELIGLSKPSRRVHGSYFSLTVTPLPASLGAKVACAVSKKVSARAVDRNRIERACREALRPLMEEIQKPVALIFYAKREAREATSALIARDIGKLLQVIERDTMLTP